MIKLKSLLSENDGQSVGHVSAAEATEPYFFREIKMKRVYTKDSKSFGVVTPAGRVENFFIGDSRVDIPVGASDITIKKILNAKFGRKTDTFTEEVIGYNVLAKGDDAAKYIKQRGQDYDSSDRRGAAGD